MFSVCWCVVFFNVLFTSAEVITIIKDTNLTCVLTKESQTLPVYVSPPTLNLYKQNKDFISLSNWSLDLTQNFEPAIDKRWEGIGYKMYFVSLRLLFAH